MLLFYLLSNIGDEEKKREVSKIEGTETSVKWNCRFFEVSAKGGLNVELAFQSILQGLFIYFLVPHLFVVCCLFVGLFVCLFFFSNLCLFVSFFVFFFFSLKYFINFIFDYPFIFIELVEFRENVKKKMKSRKTFSLRSKSDKDAEQEAILELTKEKEKAKQKEEKERQKQYKLMQEKEKKSTVKKGKKGNKHFGIPLEQQSSSSKLPTWLDDAFSFVLGLCVCVCVCLITIYLFVYLFD
jgi:hypothetical protein